MPTSRPQFLISFLASLAAFFWGASSASSLLFASRNLFVFYQDFFNQGHFFYLLAFFFWFFFPMQELFAPVVKKVFKKPNQTRYFVGAIFFLNIILFSFAAYQKGSVYYVNAHPLLFSMQFLLFYFLFGSRILYLRRAKFFLFAGIFLVIYVQVFGTATDDIVSTWLNKIWHLSADTFLSSLFWALWAWILSELFLFFSRQKNLEENIFWVQQPLYQHRYILYFLDFLRYFSLAAIFVDVLYSLRDSFIPLIILTVGFALKHFLLWRHISFSPRRSSLSLAYLFLFTFLLAAIFPLVIWSAGLYVLLSLWATVFFPQTKKEKGQINLFLSGEIIFLFFLLQFFHYSWFSLIYIAVILTALFYFIFQYFKVYRVTVSLIFLLAAGAWGFLGYRQMQKAFTVEALRPRVQYEYSPFLLSYMQMFPADGEIITNAIPASVCQKTKQFALQSKHWYSLFLSLNLRYNSKPTFYLLDFKRLGAYSQEEKGKMFLESLAANKNITALAFFDSHRSNSFYWLSQGEVVFKSAEDSGLSLVTLLSQATSDEQKKSLYELGMNLGDYFNRHSSFADALFIYQQLLPWFGTDAELYRRLSKTCGNMGALDLQIYYLQKFLQYENKIALEQERSLMELYFIKGDYKKSREVAEHLIQIDPAHNLEYLKWIFKVVKISEKENEWRKIYYRVLAVRTEMNSAQEREKFALVDNIEKFIFQNPDVLELIKKEQKRQEYLQIPEN